LIGPRPEFGLTLKARRERQGVTLQAIAESTKINVARLAALERGDLSRWPRGIFRRAYFRDYVTAIGLPPEPLVAEFTRLFPDDPGLEPVETEAPAALTMELVIDPRAELQAACRRVAVAVGELSAVLAIGALAAWLFEAALWTTSGVIGLVYYPAANMCVERRVRVRALWSRLASRPFRSPRPSPARQELGAHDLPSASELEPVSH
jgi:transcriptional regulator with XRE-family HTH domain